MRRKILMMAIGVVMASIVACGGEISNKSGDSASESTAADEIETVNEEIGSSKVNLDTPIKDMDINYNSAYVLGDNNCLYGIGSDTTGAFGIEQKTLSDFTLLAKDVAKTTWGDYLDIEGNLYLSGLWWKGGAKTTFECIDSSVKIDDYTSFIGTYITITKDNKVKVFVNPFNSSTDEDSFISYENVTDMKVPFVNIMHSGYVSTAGDAYILQRDGSFEKILSNVKSVPYIANGDTYFITDDNKLYHYGAEDDDMNSEQSLHEMASDVTYMDSYVYATSDGEMYTFDNNESFSFNSRYTELNVSDISTVYYMRDSKIIYKAKNNKIVLVNLKDYSSTEYDYTLGGAQEVFNEICADNE